MFNDQFQPCYEYYFSDLINDNFKYTRIILIDWRHVALVEDQTISLRVNIILIKVFKNKFIQ